MAESRRAALSLGANVGDWRDAFAFALRRLRETFGVDLLAVSSVYRTAPWGRTDQPEFHNMAALLASRLTPRHLLELCLAIEAERGRVRAERWGPRTLDIDLIDYEGTTLDEPDLKLPHPRAAERPFVLIPLAEIAPDLAIEGRTVADRARACDASGVAVDPTESAWFRSRFGPSDPVTRRRRRLPGH